MNSIIWIYIVTRDKIQIVNDNLFAEILIFLQNLVTIFDSEQYATWYNIISVTIFHIIMIPPNISCCWQYLLVKELKTNVCTSFGHKLVSNESSTKFTMLKKSKFFFMLLVKQLVTECVRLQLSSIVFSFRVHISFQNSILTLYVFSFQQLKFNIKDWHLKRCS